MQGTIAETGLGLGLERISGSWLRGYGDLEQGSSMPPTHFMTILRICTEPARVLESKGLLRG